MIRQICPHCFASVEFADEAAGTTADCPVCHKAFPVPGRYAPSVAGEPAARPTPPPGFVPPVAAPTAPTTSPDAPADGPGHTLTLSPTKLGWLPVTCLTLVLVLSFFSWVGHYPGGYMAYSQSPWGALAGNFETNPSSDDVLHLEKPLKAILGSNWLLLLPYLLALVVAVALGWADRALSATPVAALPVPLQGVWPYRAAVLAALAVLTLTLLALQMRLGFGLETATRKMVADQYAEALKAAETSAAEQKILVKQGMEYGQYAVQTTWWLTLAVTLHAVAAVAALLRLWLARRGTKPLPRITVWS